MKVITGSPARKDKYFKRTDIRRKLIEALINDENLLISAPRRVGKSSILLDLVDNPHEEFYPVFIDTEAVEDAEIFFKRILQAILDADKIDGFGKFTRKEKEKLSGWANRIAEFKISVISVKIEKAEEKSYYEQFTDFLDDLKLEGKKILLMIDEFPITVETIQQKSGTDAANHFLGQNRALRQNPVFQEKIKFVYTGSIGLFTAVKKINSTDKINDLRELKIPPLKREEAVLFFNELLKDECGIITTETITNYVLEKIEWWIPFYFQLLVREILNLCNAETTITKSIIDEAFTNVVKNGNIYFEHFKSRLIKIFKNPNELAFVNALLLMLKQTGWVGYSDIVNLSNDAKFHVMDELENILEVLKHDGYIVESNSKYNFYSPILKAWWK